jgi:hypothetical protein
MSSLFGCVHGYVPNLNYQFWDVFHLFFSIIIFVLWNTRQKQKLCVKETQVSAHSPCLDYYGQGEPKTYMGSLEHLLEQGL